MSDAFVIAGRTYRSRLLVGTGKYRDFAQTRAAIEESGAEIVTVAIRRTNIGQQAGEPNLLDVLPPDQFTILPNTAGCSSAEDAVRTLRLARELLSTEDRRHDLVNVVQRSHFSGSLLAAQYVSAATVFTQADAQRVGALYIVHHRVAGRKFQTLFNHAVDIFPCDQRGDGKAIGVMAHHIQRAAAN